MQFRRLLLNHALNVRDLGGYATKDGKVTRFNQFIRSDDLSLLDSKDLDTLINYGISTIIDLRGHDEIKLKPDKCANDNRFNYIHHSLMNEKIWNSVNINHPEYNREYDMGDLYVLMLKDKSTIYQLFQIILENLDSGILFHCSAGKDRTGITAMMLLLIANVETIDIQVDYQCSFDYLTVNPEFITSISKGIDSGMLLSKKEYIQKAMNYIQSFGSIQQYLYDIGLNQNEIKHIYSKLVD